MPTLINKKHRPEIAGEKDPNGINLPANCLLMSEDGFKFKINEQLLNQTKIFRDIIEDANDPDCSGIIKIFVLCQGDDLKLLVKFLCDGKIQCENEQECMKILNDLKNMFGFLDEDLDFQKIDNDRKETNEKMAIATEKVPEVNCSPIKNNMDGKIGEKSTESVIKPEEKVRVPEAQAKNIPKIYREISPIKSKKGKSRKNVAKFIIGGKKDVSIKKMEVSEGQNTSEVPKMDCTSIDGKIGEKSIESNIKPEEKVEVSEAQAKNIPKIYREISPIKSKKGKTRKNITKSIIGGKTDICSDKMEVSEGPNTSEVPKMDCSPSPIKNLDLSEEKMDTIDEKVDEEKFKESMSGDNRGPNEMMSGDNRGPNEMMAGSESNNENRDLSEEKMDAIEEKVVEEKFKESMSGDNRGLIEMMAGSQSNKDSKMNLNPINEVESVVKLEKKSSKKGFFAPFKPPQKLVIVEDEEYEGNQKVLTQL